MSYLIDISNNNFDFDNVIIGKKLVSENSNKYYFYYQNELMESPQEIYIKLPKLRLIYQFKDLKYNQVSIPIYPSYNLTDSFIEFINDFENNIKDCFVSRYPNLEFSSLINKRNGLYFLKAYLNSDVKITSKIKGITLNDFVINSEYEIVIKLQYIWNKDSRIGIHTSIYQIKYYGNAAQLNINFIDKEPVIVVKEPEINTKPIQRQLFAPSVGDLQNALTKLKINKSD